MYVLFIFTHQNQNYLNRCPPNPKSLDKLSTIKLDQALAWAGDVGRYYMGRTDINPQICENLVFVSHSTSGLPAENDGNCTQRVKSAPCTSHGYFRSYVSQFLECSYSSRYVHIDHHMLSYGCFKAINGLVHERYMGKLKRLCQHGDKNKMQTLATQTHLFETANNWLLNKQYNSAYVVEMFIIYIHLYKFILFIH